MNLSQALLNKDGRFLLPHFCFITHYLPTVDLRVIGAQKLLRHLLLAWDHPTVEARYFVFLNTPPHFISSK